MGYLVANWRKLAIIGALVSATACAPINRFHGFIPPQQELDTLAVGQTTKDEVISLFGPPIADRALQNNAIYYAASQFRYFGPFPPEEVEREVLEIDFDSADRVRNITRYTLEDGRVVVLDRRVTEDGIANVSVIGQLFDALGRIDAGAILGDEQ